MEHGQCVEQDIVGGDLPDVAQGPCDEGQVGMREHRPLGAPGGAGGVEDRGHVVGVDRGNLVERGRRPRPLGERTRSVGLECDRGPAVFARQRQDRLECAAATHEKAGAGVFDETGDFHRRVVGVQRQVDRADPQYRQVERERLGALADLRDHAVASCNAQFPKQSGDPGCLIVQLAAGPGGAPLFDDRDRCVGLGRAIAEEQREQVVLHHAVPVQGTRTVGPVRRRASRSLCAWATSARRICLGSGILTMFCCSAWKNPSASS